MAAIAKVLRAKYQQKINNSLLVYINRILSFTYQIKSYDAMKPYVDELKLRADALTLAIAKANTRDSVAIRERNERSDEAMTALNTLASYMDAYPERTVNYILDAGFNCQDDTVQKEAVKPIAPIITKIKLVASCQIKIYYDIDKNAVVASNHVQYSLNGIDWIDTDVVSQSKSIILEGLPKLKTVYVRVRSIGSKRIGPWSAVAEIDVV